MRPTRAYYQWLFGRVVRKTPRLFLGFCSLDIFKNLITRNTVRGVIWGELVGVVAVAPPPQGQRKKERKKEKWEKKKEKKKERKKVTMNNVKLLHIKCCFSNFSIVRWQWKIKKNFGPSRKSWNDAPEYSVDICRYNFRITFFLSTRAFSETEY